MRRFLLVLSLFFLAAAAAAGPAEDVVRLTNQRRAEAGLAPLALNASLARAAQSYAIVLAQPGAPFSHTGADGSTPWSRMQAAGYQGSRMGENIALGYATAETVMQAWMASPGHRANLLGAYNEIGVGVAPASWGSAWVQCFGYRAGAPAPTPEPPPPPVDTAPFIHTLAPNRGPAGTEVLIQGRNLGGPGDQVVVFNALRGVVTSASLDGTWVRARSLAGTTSGPVYVRRWRDDVRSNTLPFTVESAAPPPPPPPPPPVSNTPGTITGYLVNGVPTAICRPGDTVAILGRGLGTSGRVKWGDYHPVLADAVAAGATLYPGSRPAPGAGMWWDDVRLRTDTRWEVRVPPRNEDWYGATMHPLSIFQGKDGAGNPVWAIGPSFLKVVW